MLTEKYDFRITDQMTIPLRPHWIANDSYREKCKMLVLNRSKGEIHKVDFSKVTNPEISIKIEQKFSEESQYRAVVENHEALICYLASHGERLDEYVDSSLFYKYPDAYRSVFSKKYGSLEIPSAGIHFTWDLIQRIKDKGGLISFITLHVASTEMLSNRKFGDCMLIIQDEGQG